MAEEIPDTDEQTNPSGINFFVAAYAITQLRSGDMRRVFRLAGRVLEALVHRSPLAALAALLLVACAAMSCVSANPGGSGNPYLPLAAVRAEPAAGVIPPNVTLIRQVAAEGFQNITGWQGAFFGHVYGAQSAPDEVFNFYERELAKLGWKADLDPILSSGELRGWGWCKPRMFFRLTIFDPAQYDRTGIADGAAYRVVFDARINGSLDPCPYSPRLTLPPSRP